MFLGHDLCPLRHGITVCTFLLSIFRLTLISVTCVFSQGEVGVQLYINGFLDVTAPMFTPAKANSLPMRFGKAAAGISGNNTVKGRA